MAEDGASIVVSSRKESNVVKAVAELKSAGLNKVIGIKSHVGNKGDRTALFTAAIKEFGGLDILVSNAAVNPVVGTVLTASEEAWDKIFEINVKASFLLAKEAKPIISKRGGGSIIFISSMAGFKASSVSIYFQIFKDNTIKIKK